jgi:hypothetical protein
VTGVKTWTTDAQHADFQELLVRTDPASQRHRGLTWLICDMRSPGIEIRPITTMLLDEHVNTVFYDDVRIPRTNVVGAIGDGWATALATLAFERGTGFIGDQLELYERVQRAIALAKQVRLEDGELAIDHDDIAQRLASLKADTMAIRAMTLTSIAETDRTGVPGPKGSLMKLMVTSTHKALSEVVGDILGWDFLEFDGDRAPIPGPGISCGAGSSRSRVARARSSARSRPTGCSACRGEVTSMATCFSLRCRTRSPARRRSSTAGTGRSSDARVLTPGILAAALPARRGTVALRKARLPDDLGDGRPRVRAGAARAGEGNRRDADQPVGRHVDGSAPDDVRRATVRSAARIATDTSERGPRADARHGGRGRSRARCSAAVSAELADRPGVISAELPRSPRPADPRQREEVRLRRAARAARRSEALASLADRLPALPHSIASGGTPSSSVRSGIA